MPLISSSNYKPPFLFTNPHLQTVYPSIFRKVPLPPYKRERLTTPDDDFLDLDWSKIQADKLAIILHGLEGNSERSYMMGMSRNLNKNGWDVMAVNFRGCSGTPNKALRMYHSGETSDLAGIINHIANSPAYKRVSLVGFSLGGNVILKYLGQDPDQVHSLVHGAVVFSVPCDLTGSSIEISKPKNRLYLKRFLKMLREKIRAKAMLMPDKINDAEYEAIRSLEDFDNLYTAPLHGFSSALDYYEKSSSLQFLRNIRVPTLLVNAADDPFLSKSCFPTEIAKKSTHLHLEIPAHGGHVGFVSFNREAIYWSERRAAEFLQQF